MEIEKIDFREAASILAKEAGIEMSTNFAREKAEHGQDVYALYREATDWYHRIIFHTENTKALDYILARGISMDTIKKFQLGYSSSPRDLLYFLKEKWFETKFIVDSGLFLSETRDKFFGRIVFPIANTMWHTVAFTGRVMDDAMPKYLNSPASHIFDKSSILYGFHLAKQSIAKSGDVYIVEWQMDTIALHQAWVDNSVGISGTALTKEHIRLLRRFAKTIYLALDSDNAWVKATFASIENLLNADIEIKIIHIPNGKDPDEYTKSGGDFAALRESALSVIDFYLREWGREFDVATLVWKKKLVEKCLEVIAHIKSQVEVDFYLQEISRWLWVGMEALYTEYKKIRLNVRQKSRIETIKTKEAESSSQEKLTWKESYQPTIFDLIAWYIFRYDFLDLFFREFRYTNPDLEQLSNATLLYRLVSQDLDPSDHEALRILDLRLEEEHLTANPELIERAFRDLLRVLHMDLLKIEKEKLLSSLDTNSSEYLQVYTQLVQKEKSFRA